MRFFLIDDTTVYLGGGHETHTFDDVQRGLLCLKQSIFGPRPLIQQITDLWNRRHGYDGSLTLWVHAGGRKNPWTFGDGQRRHLVQRWIDRHDGEAGTILIIGCNHGHKTVRSENSIVIHPNRTLSMLCPQQAAWRFFVPGHGYLDTWRQRRRVLNQLRTELRLNGRHDH